MSTIHVSDEGHQRFNDFRYAAQERVGATELTHAEAMSIVMDIVELHCQREGLAPVAEPEPQVVADGGTVTVDAETFEAVCKELQGIADDLHGSGLDISACAIGERVQRLEDAAEEVQR